jgi:hypothetical protein
VKPKPKKHQSSNIAKAPTARPASANLNAKVVLVAGKQMAPPVPQNINKSTETQKTQPITRKNSMPQATRPSPAIEKQSTVAQEKHEILSVLMDAGNDWKPRNKGTDR